MRRRWSKVLKLDWVRARRKGRKGTINNVRPFTPQQDKLRLSFTDEASITAPSPGAAVTATRTTAVAPPPRRGGSATVVETTQVHVHASNQAKAIYDYSSGDSGDLSVQSGQVINVVEKTSADCEFRSTRDIWSQEPGLHAYHTDAAQGGHVPMEAGDKAWSHRVTCRSYSGTPQGHQVYMQDDLTSANESLA